MRIGLYDLLPLIIRLRDEEASGAGGQDPILKRIVGTVVQDETDSMVALIAGMRDLLSVGTTTDLILSLLARYLGLTEYPFSEVVTNRREYVASLVDSHRIKGTLLSILRDMNARNIAEGHYIHELWKYVLNAVDEYVPTAIDAPYSTAYKAARVVFIQDPYGEGPPEDGPAPSDGSTLGIFAENQVPYLTAKGWREDLNNVFPIHVLIPPPVRRVGVDDTAPVMTDDLGGQIYVMLDDQYPLIEDDLEIFKQCISVCQVSCQERCETLCEFTCETTCETACQAQCEEGCQAVCQSFCEASCELGCQDACQSFCQSDCQTTCQSACEVTCQQACQFGCQDAAENCQSFCEFNCQTDAEIICEDQCQITCQTAAQEPCPDGGPPGGEGT